MTWSEVTVVVVLVLLLALWWVWAAANRLDRLHRKVATTRATLDNQLVRRASVASELAACGYLDPVSSVLIGEAAWSALEAGRAEEARAAELGTADPHADPGASADAPPPVARELAESELSRTLRVALAPTDEDDRNDDRGEDDAGEPDPRTEHVPAPELLEALAAAWFRVELARRFHNEAVAQTQRMRSKPFVRLLRLAGRAPVPATVEIDDTWPEALTRPGHRT